MRFELFYDATSRCVARSGLPPLRVTRHVCTFQTSMIKGLKRERARRAWHAVRRADGHATSTSALRTSTIPRQAYNRPSRHIRFAFTGPQNLTALSHLTSCRSTYGEGCYSSQLIAPAPNQAVGRDDAETLSPFLRGASPPLVPLQLPLSARPPPPSVDPSSPHAARPRPTSQARPWARSPSGRDHHLRRGSWRVRRR
jgi:hypothetical protein